MELIRNLWRYTISLIINLMLIPLILLRTTYMKGFSVAFGNFFTKPVLPKFDEKKFCEYFHPSYFFLCVVLMISFKRPVERAILSKINLKSS